MRLGRWSGPGDGRDTTGMKELLERLVGCETSRPHDDLAAVRLAGGRFIALINSLMALNSGRSAVSVHSKSTASVVETTAPGLFEPA